MARGFHQNPTCKFKAPKPTYAKKFVAPPQPCRERMMYIPGLKLRMGMEPGSVGPPPPAPGLAITDNIGIAITDNAGNEITGN